VIYLDANAVIALDRKEMDRFSRRAEKALEVQDDIRVSPIVILELEFLREIKRVKKAAEIIIDELAAEIGLRVCDTPFHLVIRKAVEERWTRDPFDRLIVAQARVHSAPLLTLDTVILQHYPHALA
jgi:PIN domain nuclease of toxin-antitoxin system